MEKFLYRFFRAEIKEEVKKALLEIGRENVQDKLQLDNFIYKSLGKNSPSSKDFESLVPFFVYPVSKVGFNFTMHITTPFGIETKDESLTCENFSQLYKIIKTAKENPQSCFGGLERIDGFSEIKIALWYSSLGERKLQQYYVDGVSSKKIFYQSDFSRICEMLLGKLDQYPEMLL